jgi:hypothetical protein
VQLLPVLCLVCVALNQLRLVAFEQLSPWSGGGFGMFSTTDAATDRHIHVYEITPAWRREVRVPFEFEDTLRRALALPGDAQLENLTAQLIEQGFIARGSSVEIQVWANRYDSADLRPQSVPIRLYRADDTSAY